MATQPIKYVYKATRYFKTTTYYDLQTETEKPLLSNKLNISENRGFAKSKPLFWCKEHSGKKWVKPCITGLFATGKDEIFWGCRGKYEHLILFVFANSKEDLTVYYYPNYYTRNINGLIKHI